MSSFNLFPVPDSFLTSNFLFFNTFLFFKLYLTRVAAWGCRSPSESHAGRPLGPETFDIIDFMFFQIVHTYFLGLLFQTTLSTAKASWGSLKWLTMRSKNVLQVLWLHNIHVVKVKQKCVIVSHNQLTDTFDDTIDTIASKNAQTTHLGEASSEPRDDFFRSRLQEQWWSYIADMVPPTCPHVPVSTFRSLFCPAASPLAQHGAGHGARHHGHDGAPHHLPDSTLANPSSRNDAVPFPMDRHYFSLWANNACKELTAIFTVSSLFTRADLSQPFWKKEELLIRFFYDWALATTKYPQKVQYGRGWLNWSSYCHDDLLITSISFSVLRSQSLSPWPPFLMCGYY